jgi:hypothetical protein
VAIFCESSGRDGDTAYSILKHYGVEAVNIQSHGESEGPSILRINGEVLTGAAEILDYCKKNYPNVSPPQAPVILPQLNISSTSLIEAS